MKKTPMANISQLLAVEATARLMSFQRAAEELSITASAVSHRVKDYEQATKTEMFYRFTRRIELTTTALQQLPKIRGIIRDIKALNRSSQKRATITTNSKLKISVPPLFFSQIVLPKFSELKDGYEIDVYVNQENQLLSKFDVVICYGRIQKEGWSLEKLMSGRQVLVYSPHMINSQTEPSSISHVLKHYPMIGLPVSSKKLKNIISRNKASGFSLPEISVSNMTEGVVAARAGLGVAVAIKELVHQDIQRGSLMMLEEDALPNSSFYVATKSNRKKNIAVKRFKYLLKNLVSIQVGYR